MKFEPGQIALLIDERGRKYLVSLKVGGEFHFHRGIVAHDEILGGDDGLVTKSTGGEAVAVFRPTYADYALKMRRGAQIIYPKDTAQIIIYADIYPGARVLEAGVGSGALTMALLRAVGPTGSVVSYDVREDFIERARKNIAGFLGETINLEIRLGSVYAPLGAEPGAPEALSRPKVGSGERTANKGANSPRSPSEVFDRVVLDLAEPWHSFPHLTGGALRPGGILAIFLPTVLQVSQATEALKSSSRWTLIRTLENLTRTWHVDGQSVRPDHKMIGHTGFLTFARLVAP